MTLAKVEFTISRPNNWEVLDLAGPDVDDLVGQETRDALVRFSVGNEYGRLMMARSLFSASEDGRQLGMGLVVTLSSTEMVAEGPLDPDALDGDVSAITLFIGAGVRRRFVKPAQVPGGRVPMLLVQYLIETEVGMVTMTFTTANGVAGGTEQWEELFDTMASTAQLIPAE